MWEVVAVSLISYLGKKTIDEFWSKRRSDSYPVISQDGNIGYANLDSGRVSVERSLTVSRSQRYETLFGKLYVPDTIEDLLGGDEIALVLVIEERSQQAFLFETNLDEGYQIDLPYGIYSVFVFIVDSDEEDLFDAMIYAIGFPCAEDIDLSDIDHITAEDHEDIWDIIDDSPVKITRGGPFYLDIILIDTEEIPEFPQFFSEIL
jgi:hypothetical protein